MKQMSFWVLHLFLLPSWFLINVFNVAKRKPKIKRKFSCALTFVSVSSIIVFKITYPSVHSGFCFTCSKDLLVQTSHCSHGNRNVFKETNQAEIAKILQLDALLVALGHSLTFEEFVQNLKHQRQIVSDSFRRYKKEFAVNISQVTKLMYFRMSARLFSPWRLSLWPLLRSFEWAAGSTAAPRPTPAAQPAPAHEEGCSSAAHTAHPRLSPPARGRREWWGNRWRMRIKYLEKWIGENEVLGGQKRSLEAHSKVILVN